jgi:hypothetical protein
MSNAFKIDSFGSRSRRNRSIASMQREGSAASFAQRSDSSGLHRDSMPAFAARIANYDVENQAATAVRGDQDRNLTHL